MNVVVTGSAGYIGTALMDHLDNPTGVDRPDDVRDEADLTLWLADADAVVHLAAIPGVEACEADPATAVRNNLEATATVARVCEKTDCRLVLASSAAAGGETTYGWTKRVGVEVCRRLPALDWVALEFSNVYGGTGKGTVVETFIEQVRDGGPLTVHDPGTQERNFVHRADVAEACRLAVQSDTNGVVPVCGPDTMTINELARQVKRRIDVEITRVDPTRPVGPMEVEADLDNDLGYRPERSIAEYLDEVLGYPKREVGV